MNDCKLITVCTHYPQQDYYCLDSFIKSIVDNEIIVLGSEPNSYSGLGSKPKLLYKAIKDGVLNTKYLLFTDCWDFVFSISPEHLFTSYLQWFPDTPIVISSEKNCFPYILKEEYDALSSTSSYKYLNSGMIIGETEKILSLLEIMHVLDFLDDYRQEDGQMFHLNDQFEYMKIFLELPHLNYAPKMVMDYNQILCNTLHSVTLDELSFEPQGIRNIETGRVPCSFHFNGDAKTKGLRKPILEHLNLL